jgi:hypothetical protein
VSTLFSVKRAVTLAALALATGIAVSAAFLLTLDYTRDLRIESVYPRTDEVGVEPNTTIKLAFNKAISDKTIIPATFQLHDRNNGIVPAAVTYEPGTHTAILLPESTLHAGETYEVAVKGGPQGILDRQHHALARDKIWRFTTGTKTTLRMTEGPGGPILVITSRANGFSQYYAEILRNEGLNEFDVKDLGEVSTAELAKYDLVLAGEIPIDDQHARMLAGWVRAGGNLVTMRPTAKLAEELGLSPPVSGREGPVQHGGYLRIDSSTQAGAGLVKQAIQFHGDADRAAAKNATVVATLYRDNATPTQFPAVSSIRVGSGNAVVFAYDLARSVVYTRQGNPEWSGVERDGIPPIRSDDLFYGASEKDPKPDWVDPQLIAIPQADIQQRLLVNLIILANATKKPLPRFWYLPRGLKAVIVMTGDDHGLGGTAGRFLSYLHKSASGCSLENWECIRATAHIFVGSISSEQATQFTKEGFEIGLHVYTGCADWPTKSSQDDMGVERREISREFVDTLYSQQLQGFAIRYPALPPPTSNRTDCVTWGDYDMQPQIELNHQMRLDTNYYYWPAKWVQNKPGLFTGSGLPMRFARRDGSLIDVYQAPTQMTDESNQSYPFTVDTLLKNALGRSEYFGVFTANMHNDLVRSPGADSILSAARKYHVPVITAGQLLKWLDGRNASKFSELTWSGNELSFSTDVGIGGSGIEVMLPFHSAAGDVYSISLNGREIQWQRRTVAGLSNAVVRAGPGIFRATYGYPAAQSTAERAPNH